MAGDQFTPAYPGQPFKPSAAQWNAMLAAARAYQRGEPAAGGPVPAARETAAEVLVKNASGAAAGWFAVLQPTAPLITQAASDATFRESRTPSCGAPAAGAPFVVTQGPVANGYIGRATVLGLTPVRVTINDTAHRYADCTTATDKLSSGPTGTARILWDEDNFAATGDRWALVELTGTAPTAYARFTLPSALAATDASKAACTVDGYFGAGNPGSTITVFNLPASSNYIFSGASGNKGLAVYDLANQKWWIVQMQCP